MRGATLLLGVVALLLAGCGGDSSPASNANQQVGRAPFGLVETVQEFPPGLLSLDFEDRILAFHLGAGRVEALSQDGVAPMARARLPDGSGEVVAVSHGRFSSVVVGLADGTLGEVNGSSLRFERWFALPEGSGLWVARVDGEGVVLALPGPRLVWTAREGTEEAAFALDVGTRVDALLASPDGAVMAAIRQESGAVELLRFSAPGTTPTRATGEWGGGPVSLALGANGATLWLTSHDGWQQRSASGLGLLREGALPFITGRLRVGRAGKRLAFVEAAGERRVAVGEVARLVSGGEEPVRVVSPEAVNGAHDALFGEEDRLYVARPSRPSIVTVR